MRASRSMSALALAGLTAAGTVGAVATGAGATSSDHFGCYAFANPSTGPTMSNGQVVGQGSGYCKAENGSNITFAEVDVLFEVRRLDTDSWLYGGGFKDTTQPNTTLHINMNCVSGSWEYRVTTNVYGKNGGGTRALASWTSTAVQRYSCK